MEFAVGILGAGVGSGLMAIVLAALQRRWKKQDEGRIDHRQFAALVASQKLLMADRIRYLGSCYIYSRQITLEEKENLQEMFESYKSLGGNGHLDAVMAEIGKLAVTRGEK